MAYIIVTLICALSNFIIKLCGSGDLKFLDVGSMTRVPLWCYLWCLLSRSFFIVFYHGFDVLYRLFCLMDFYSL